MKFALALLALVAPCTAIDVRNFAKGDLAKDLQDFKDLVPTDKIVEITSEYMSEDKEFQKVVAYLQSEEFRQLVIDFESIPEVHVLMKYLQNADIDIYEMVNKLNDLLNIDRIKPPKSGSCKISGGETRYVYDVWKMLQLDAIVAITFKYMSEDEEFQKVMAYLQSEEFRQFVIDFESIPELHVLMKYLQNAGIDIYEMVNKLNDLLNIDRIKPPKSSSYKISGGGIKGYEEDVWRVLPQAKIKALYRKKLAMSKAFADFLEQLKSDDFKRIIDAVHMNPEFTRINKKLREAGINLY